MSKKIVYQHQLRKEFYDGYPEYKKYQGCHIPATIRQEFRLYKLRMFKCGLISKRLFTDARL